MIAARTACRWYRSRLPQRAPHNPLSNSPARRLVATLLSDADRAKAIEDLKSTTPSPNAWHEVSTA
jgi:hypothetical protein